MEELLQHQKKKYARHIPLTIEMWDRIEDRMRVSKRGFGAEIELLLERVFELEKQEATSSGVGA